MGSTPRFQPLIAPLEGLARRRATPSRPLVPSQPRGKSPSAACCDRRHAGFAPPSLRSARIVRLPERVFRVPDDLTGVVLDLDAGVAPPVQPHAPHLLLPAQVDPVPRAAPVVLAVVLGDAVRAKDPQVDPGHEEPERGSDLLLRLDPNPGELVDQTEHGLPPGLAADVRQSRRSTQRAQPAHPPRRRGGNLGRRHATPLPRRLQDRHQIQQREIAGQLVHRVDGANQAETIDALRSVLGLRRTYTPGRWT